MVHKKSLKAQQRRMLKLEQKLRARRLLNDMNFHDTELDEVIHTVEEADVITVLMNWYGHVDRRVVNLICATLKRFERGEVRVDSRSRGSVQQLREHEKPWINKFT